MKVWEKNINRSIATYKKGSYEEYKSYERFKFVKKIMEKKLKATGDLLDIGCAKGEFIWLLKDSFPKISFTGFDLSDELITLAKSQPDLSDVTFLKADVQNFDLKRKFDFASMMGVLSMFDDFKKPLRLMVKHLKKGGWGYIFGIFSEDDVDVLVRFRNNYLGSKIWESGYNMFCRSSIKKELSTSCENIRFYKFDIPIDLPKEKDPVKSYTLNTAEKGRIILNGVNILHHFYLVEFKKR